MRKKVEVVLLVVAVVATGYFLLRRGGDVSSGDARRLVEEGAVLVDVRTRGEFEAGHIDGAVNIPIDELEGRIAELPPRSEPLVVYCQSGSRSSRAASLLRDAGFRGVHDLGAMSRW